MKSAEQVTTSRDVDAVVVPFGTPVTIPAGTEVLITQALGGSYTVNVNGNLVRIEGNDADALGKEVQEAQTQVIEGDGTADEEKVWEQLRTCYDPEIPVNIVELGLIYDCKITPVEGGGNRVDITMTLTAPGCGMGGFIAAEVEQKVRSVPNVTEAAVNLTFDPPWDRSMMSEAAKLELGMF